MAATTNAQGPPGVSWLWWLPGGKDGSQARPVMLLLAAGLFERVAYMPTDNSTAMNSVQG